MSACPHRRVVRITTDAPESFGRDECFDCHRMSWQGGLPGRVVLTLRGEQLGTSYEAYARLSVALSELERDVLAALGIRRLVEWLAAR